MTVCGKLWGLVLARLPLVIAVAGVGGLGCGRQGQQPAQQKTEAPAQPGAAKETPPAQPQQPARTNAAQRAFAEATRSDPPADWPPPPDVTRTGKSVGKLYTE